MAGQRRSNADNVVVVPQDVGMQHLDRGVSKPIPDFLTKTYDIVDDPSTDSIISWAPNGASFIVWNDLELCRDLIPKYFKHKTFTSFHRQLNNYGFKKINPEWLEFVNDDFVKEQRHTLKNIHKQKSSVCEENKYKMSGPESERAKFKQKNDKHKPSSHELERKRFKEENHKCTSDSELEKAKLKEEIETLKSEKDKLFLDLQKQNKHKQIMEQQLKSLEDRLQAMEIRERTTTKILPWIFQSLQYLSNRVCRPCFYTHEKRRFMESGYFSEENDIEAELLLTSQGVSTKESETTSADVLSEEQLQEQTHPWMC